MLLRSGWWGGHAICCDVKIVMPGRHEDAIEAITCILSRLTMPCLFELQCDIDELFCRVARAYIADWDHHRGHTPGSTLVLDNISQLCNSCGRFQNGAVVIR